MYYLNHSAVKVAEDIFSVELERVDLPRSRVSVAKFGD